MGFRHVQVYIRCFISGLIKKLEASLWKIVLSEFFSAPRGQPQRTALLNLATDVSIPLNIFLRPSPFLSGVTEK